MKSFFGMATLLFVGVAGWRIGGQLSADVLGMAIGILFGVMAGIPTALILLASQRRDRDLRDAHPGGEKTPHQLPHNAHGYQPPVIVVAGHAPTQPQFGQQFAGLQFAGQHGQQMGYNAQGGPYNAPYGQHGIYAQQALLPGPVAEGGPARQFKVVGEVEEMLEQW